MSHFVFPPVAPTIVSVEGGALFPVRRVFCVGQNYAEHAREMGADPSKGKPTFFYKPTDAVIQKNEIRYPPATANFHYEGEMVIAIGKGGTDISVSSALEHVFGYAAGCDLTRRDLQGEAKKAGKPWDMGKGFDESAPIGAIRPAFMVANPGKGRIATIVNGVQRQEGDLADMIWPAPEIIAHLSALVALAPGDLIYSGTPAGVGALAVGDKVEIIVEGIGESCFTII